MRFLSLALFLLLLFSNLLFLPVMAETILPIPKKDEMAAPASPVSEPGVMVRTFRFSGNTLLSAEELEHLLSPFCSKSCTIVDLRQATALVTKAYHDRGYKLAKAYLPVQRIDNGIVMISILEGRIGQIIITGNRNYSERFIRNYLLRGETEAELTVDKLEGALLLLNTRFSDLKVTANFTTGLAPGTTDLQVRVDDGSPLHGALSANNYGSEFVSRYRFGGQIEWSNVLVQGSLLSMGGMVGDNIERMHVFNAAYALPLNSRATMAGIEFSDGTFDVGKDFADLGIHNREASLNLSLSHPLIKSRAATLTGQLGFRGSDARYYQLDALSSKDNIRALYASLQGDLVHNGGKSVLSLTLSRGLGELLDGTVAGDPLASRAGADNDFYRLNGSFARLQPFSTVFSALLRCSGQWGSDRLLAGEEWLLGGVNSVHGYAPGEESGKKGYSVSLALRASPLKQRELLTLSAFLDHGYAWQKSGSPAGSEGRSLTGAGVGLSSTVDLAVPAEFRLDVGWPLDPRGNARNESPVLYFETALRF
jgi:hemolysin activation/secretion protein